MFTGIAINSRSAVLQQSAVKGVQLLLPDAAILDLFAVAVTISAFIAMIKFNRYDSGDRSVGSARTSL